MTNLLLNEKTIPTLARGFVQGVNNKVKMQDAITESMQAFIVDENMQAKAQLENLWLALEHNKKALAVLRSQYNTISKRVKKANGAENPVALTVTEGVLTDVVPRNKGATGTGTGEGEGATESTATAPDLALISALETLDRMLKACKDTEQCAALKLAIARLAATV